MTTKKKAPAKPAETTKATAPKAAAKGPADPQEAAAARDATMAEDVQHLRTVGQVATTSKAERG